MTVRYRALLLLAVTCVASSVLAQDPGTKLRLAQSYEQAGDHEQAVRLYQDLHRLDPGNIVFFEGMRRTLLQLKRYDEAAVLIRERLASSPTDVSLRAQLGSVYYRAGNDTLATEEWEKAIAVGPANQTVYRTVAAVLIENRLLERAIDLYRRARVACGDPNLFTADLASLLSTMMDYAGATGEYLELLRQNPAQLGFVQGRMASFTDKEAARSTATGIIRERLRHQEDLQLERLLGWLEGEGKRYDEALEVYRRIDELSNARGGELYAFAERVFKDGNYEVAARAYREAIGVPVSAERMPYARYGYASALKGLGARPDSSRTPVGMAVVPVPESQGGLTRAIDEFNGIIRDYPRSEFSARSWYQIGLIRFERLFDLDAALTAFEQAEREIPSVPLLRYDIGLRIGTVLLARGDTSKAAQRFHAVADAPDALPDQQDEGTFRLAEVAYFGGEFDSAMQLLNSLALNLKADYANDALQLMAFLQENTTAAPAALAAYARADFIARQRRNGEAIPLFLGVIKDYPQALLVDDALMKVGMLQAQAGRYADALASYERLLTDFNESSIALDRAQFNAAEILQFGLHDQAKAIAAYERLLASYPGSLLVTIARKRIRDLRGDTM
jgi:tetratricopeptide (TPR) repeat protein